MHSTRHSALMRELRAIFVFSIPYIIFQLTFASLVYIYGGHHHAILGQNPFCTQRSPDTPFHQWKNSSVPHVLVQISDLHVNEHDSGIAKRQMQTFFENALPNWAPLSNALIVTGDLVDAELPSRYPLGVSSAQLPTEWQYVQQYAEQVNRSIPWIAVHGNHDTFGEILHEHSYSSSAASLVCSSDGHEGQRLRKTSLRIGDESLHLLAMECSVRRPLNRPLNFFGDATTAAKQLSETLDELDGADVSNVLAFGHYPSSIMKNGKRVHKSLHGKSSRKPRTAAYLSGHLHTMHGLAPFGMQAVSKSGAFELELADMVGTGTYRILAFDNGYLSFHDFRIDEPSLELVVTNPPQAGFCSAGAGHAARSSSHIRVVVSGSAIRERLFVDIDDIPFGELAVLPTGCQNGALACQNVMGVAWNSSQWDDGSVHKLTIRAGNSVSSVHLFSLDGRPEDGWMAYMGRLRSAIFLFTEFDNVAEKLCMAGFGICVLFLWTGLRKRERSSFYLFSICVLLYTLPVFVIAPNLTADGWGMAGLHAILLPTGAFPAGVDSAYLLSVTVLWGTLVPLCFLDNLYMREVRILQESWLLPVFLLVYARGCFSWTLEILGAHGVLSALVSVSCVPLAIAVAFVAAKCA